MAQQEGEREELFQEFLLQSALSHTLTFIFKDVKIEEPAALKGEVCCTDAEIKQVSDPHCDPPHEVNSLCDQF